MSQKLTKDDYLILLGDCGICWADGINDSYVKQTLINLPITTLWIDGNHENFDLINEYDIEEWNGGKVHFIDDSIIHLMRGQVFKINDLSFFTFGGAYSTDKYNRTEGINWWREEIPSKEDYQEGFKNLKIHHNKIDYILTHTAPYEVIIGLGIDLDCDDEEVLPHYLQQIADNIDFKEWMFGHFHIDEDIENYHALYDRIIML